LPYPYTLAAALVLASVYVFGHKLRAKSHHRRWISVAAGVSVAWVFVDLLPEISENQARFSTGPHRGAALFPEQAIYLAAMLGFVLFYALEYIVSGSEEDGEPSRVFSSVRIAAFAGYSALIAYLLIHNVWKDATTLLLYTLAMSFHFLLVDHSLFSDHYGKYEGRLRWILALSVVVGWFVGILTSIPDQWMARIIGFVSGGVLMNTVVVELPEGRGGRFWPFALAAAAYSAFLLLVLG
jgi:hypothetical protein